MTKGDTKTNIPKSLESDGKKKKAGSVALKKEEPVVVLTEEQQLENELKSAQERLKSIAIGKKKEREQHEKEIKKKLHDEHDNQQHGSAESHSGVKRSKPTAALGAYQFFKNANSSKGNGWCLEKWREMDEVAKKPFNDQAAKDKERFNHEMEEYEKIHAKVTHHKVQKKDLRKKEDELDENGEKKNTGPKKLTKKEKLQKLKEQKEAAKLERLNRGRTPKDIARSPSSGTSPTSKSKHSSDEEEEEEEYDSQEEEDDVDDDDDEDDDEDDDDEDDDDEEEDEDDIVDENEIYIDDDDDGFRDMKNGFKSSNPRAQSIKKDVNRRWNK